MRSREPNSPSHRQTSPAGAHARGRRWCDDAMRQEYVGYIAEQRRTIRDKRLRANVRCIGWLLVVSTTAAFHAPILRIIGL